LARHRLIGDEDIDVAELFAHQPFGFPELISELCWSQVCCIGAELALKDESAFKGVAI
jgi:hypothetical protein